MSDLEIPLEFLDPTDQRSVLSTLHRELCLARMKSFLALSEFRGKRGDRTSVHGTQSMQLRHLVMSLTQPGVEIIDEELQNGVGSCRLYCCSSHLGRNPIPQRPFLLNLSFSPLAESLQEAGGTYPRDEDRADDRQDGLKRT